MATEKLVEKLKVVKIQSRTGFLTINTRDGNVFNPVIEVHRDDTEILEDGSVGATTNRAPIVKQLGEVALQEVVLDNGKIISGTEVAEAIKRFADSWDV
jgi:hypothetical protein